MQNEWISAALWAVQQSGVYRIPTTPTRAMCMLVVLDRPDVVRAMSVIGEQRTALHQLTEDCIGRYDAGSQRWQRRRHSARPLRVQPSTK